MGRKRKYTPIIPVRSIDAQPRVSKAARRKPNKSNSAGVERPTAVESKHVGVAVLPMRAALLELGEVDSERHEHPGGVQPAVEPQPPVGRQPLQEQPAADLERSTTDEGQAPHEPFVMVPTLTCARDGCVPCISAPSRDV